MSRKPLIYLTFLQKISCNCPGIRTALQLQNVDPRWMRQRFSVVGERLVRELQGLSCLPIQSDQHHQKSIQISRSFGKAVTQITDLEEAMAMHIEKLAERLRKQNAVTQQITIFANGSCAYQLHENLLHTVNLDEYTHDTHVLLKEVLPYVKFLFQSNLRYKKAGLSVSNILSVNQARCNRSIFYLPPPYSSPISQTLDKIRERYGRGKLGFGQLGILTPKEWTVRCNHRSPKYTTCWKDLLIVR